MRVCAAGLCAMVLGGALVISGHAQDAAVARNAATSAPAAIPGNAAPASGTKLTPLQPWSPTTIKLVTPGKAGPPAVPFTIVDFPARAARYEFGSCVALFNQGTGKIYIAINRGVQDFYLLSANRMIGLSYFPDGQLIWSESLLEISDPSGNLDAAIARFEAEFYAVKRVGGIDLYQSANGQGTLTSASPHQTGRVILRVAQNPNFFITGSGGRPNDVKMNRFEVSDDVVHIDLTAVATGQTAGFWINLKSKQIVRATVDGVEVPSPSL